jgi:hypothetical protein
LNKNTSELWTATVAEAYKTDEAPTTTMVAADQFLYQLYEVNVTINAPTFSKLLNA